MIQAKPVRQRLSRFLIIAGLMAGFMVGSVNVSAQNYKILLSNDDGISSPLLATLKATLEALPEVTVIVSAPNENQSGSSQSSSSGQLIVENYQQDGRFFGYAVHGKPADAVRFGLAQLRDGDDFDLVVSGINRGANVGDVSHLSGTIGAAMEALYHGVPAIAISQAVTDVDTQVSANFVASLVQRYQQHSAPRGTVLSINVPGGELKGIAVKPMGDSYLQTADFQMVEQNEQQSVYSRQRSEKISTDLASDTNAYQNGFITVTPLKFDWTDYELIPQIQSWELDIVE